MRGQMRRILGLSRPEIEQIKGYTPYQSAGLGFCPAVKPVFSAPNPPKKSLKTQAAMPWV